MYNKSAQESGKPTAAAPVGWNARSHAQENLIGVLFMTCPENTLNKAMLAYQNATELITSMVANLQRINHCEYAATDFIARYDLILQGILLHIAIADGTVSEAEYRFIEGITRYGDLLDTLNRRHDPPGAATWRDFSRIPRALCRELLRLCDQIVSDTTKSFITGMAHVDETTIHIDELEMLRTYTTTIMEALSGIDRAPDGSDEKKERASGIKARLSLLERPWNDALSYL